MNTFAIGTIRTGDFVLHVSHSPFLSFEVLSPLGYKYHDISRQMNLEYYDVNLTQLKKYDKLEEVSFYIDLLKLGAHDSYFNFSRPTPGLQDEKELQSWTHNKSMSMPMWHLRKETVQRLINLLYNLAERKITLLSF